MSDEDRRQGNRPHGEGADGREAGEDLRLPDGFVRDRRDGSAEPGPGGQGADGYGRDWTAEYGGAYEADYGPEYGGGYAQGGQDQQGWTRDYPQDASQGYGENYAHEYGSWQQTAPGSDYDGESTTFLQLPPDDAAGTAPLEAPGHGYTPPMILPLKPLPGAAGTDPGAPGGWSAQPAPPAPGDGAGQGRTPDAGQQGAEVRWPDAGAGTGDPHATGQWTFPEEPGPAPGAAEMTGQWSVPIADGDLPEESGEYLRTAPRAAEPAAYPQAATPPATLPGGAPAPWTTLPGGASAPWAPAAPEATGHGPGAGTDGSGAHAEPYGTGPGDAYPAAPEGHGERLGSGAGDGATAHDAGHTPAGGVPAAAFAPREPGAPEASEVPEAHAPDAAAHPVAAGHPEPADGVPAAPQDPAQAPDPAHAPDAPESGHAPDAQAPTHAPDAPQAEPAADGDGDGDAPAGDAAPAPEAGPSAGAPDEGADADGTGRDADGVPAASDEHPATSYVLRVNGTDRPVTDAWIGESLLYVLRERLGLAGAKDGCSQGECGACNVQVDGRLVASCLVPAATTAGSEVRTVEGLATDGEPSDVQRALAACGAVQCGFCIPGMAMTVHDLLEGNHAPTELETRQALCGNLCRCSGYQGVLAAVREVAAGRAERAAAAAAGTAPDGGSAEPGRDEARIPHQAPPGAGSVQAHPHDGGMA